MSNQNFDDVNDVVSARLRKHAAEIERLQAAHQQEMERVRKQAADAFIDGCLSVSAKGAELHAGILRRARKRMLLIMLAIIAILTIQSEFRIHGLKEDLRATQALLDEATRPWRSDDAPKLQRLTVVAEGFMDKKGEWRSFDDGSHLTVKQWKQ